MSEEKMSPEQEKALRAIGENLHKLNYAIIKAVDAGLSVELMRTSRYHDERGGWGDQVIPIIHRLRD